MNAAVAFPTNEWKHVMVVQEVGLETTEASIYLDGVLKTSGAVSNPGTVDRDCYLAKFRDSASGEFVGEMCARPPPPHAAHRTPRAAHTPSTPNAAPPAVLQIRRLRLELRSRCYAARRPLARGGRAHERGRRPPRDRMLDALDAEPAAEPAAAEPAAPVLAAGAAAEPAAAEPAAEPATAEPATALAARHARRSRRPRRHCRQCSRRSSRRTRRRRRRRRRQRRRRRCRRRRRPGRRRPRRRRWRRRRRRAPSSLPWRTWASRGGSARSTGISATMTTPIVRSSPQMPRSATTPTSKRVTTSTTTVC